MRGHLCRLRCCDLAMQSDDLRFEAAFHIARRLQAADGFLQGRHHLRPAAPLLRQRRLRPGAPL